LEEGKSSYWGRSHPTRDVGREVSRGHISCGNEPNRRMKSGGTEDSQSDEGLNVKEFPM